MTVDQIIAKLKELAPEQDFKSVEENGRVGITVNGESIAPVVWMDDAKHFSGPDEILKVLQSGLENACELKGKVERLFKDKEELLKRVVRTVAPLERNDFGRQFLDLRVVYRIALDDENSVVITKALADHYEFAEDELWEASAEKCVYDTQSMQSILDGLVDLQDSFPMLVISNQKRMWGAASMLDDEVLSAAADKLQSDLIILPSSIHEIIVIPFSGDDVSEFNAMIREVNETQLQEREVLSDHYYFYRKEAHTVECDGFEPYNLIK